MRKDIQANASNKMTIKQEKIAIPLIDLGPMRSGEPQQAARIGRDVFEAFRDVGFAYIQNHGVPQDLIDQMFEWVSFLSSHFCSKANPLTLHE